MRIAVYIPEDHEKSQEAIKRLAELICKHSGGLTVYPCCSGLWKDDSGVLVQDNISVVETFCNESVISIFKPELVKELLVIRELLSQDCIAYTIDNNIYFV